MITNRKIPPEDGVEIGTGSRIPMLGGVASNLILASDSTTDLHKICCVSRKWGPQRVEWDKYVSFKRLKWLTVAS